MVNVYYNIDNISFLPVFWGITIVWGKPRNQISYMKIAYWESIFEVYIFCICYFKILIFIPESKFKINSFILKYTP